MEPAAIVKLAKSKGWFEDINGLLNKKELKEIILLNFKDLAKTNKLSGLEKIKKIHLTTEPFSVDNDLLTPSFKIKRNMAKKYYKNQIDEMYASGLK